MSARPASSVRRGSATMSLARFSCASFSAAPNTGCDSVVLAPAMKMTSHANTTESHPVFGAALKRAHEKRAKLIVADPRRTELAGRADIPPHMQPGTAGALDSAMLNHILALGLENKKFSAELTPGRYMRGAAW